MKENWKIPLSDAAQTNSWCIGQLMRCHVLLPFAAESKSHVGPQHALRMPA